MSRSHHSNISSAEGEPLKQPLGPEAQDGPQEDGLETAHNSSVRGSGRGEATTKNGPTSLAERSSIPFNKAFIAGRELYYIAQAVANGELKGDGPFTARCHAWFQDVLGIHKALLTCSCSAALEMCALLLDLKEGDEVILPSFTFTSTANAFLLRGCKLVFVDIRPDTLNIDEQLIASKITGRTKAICVVHYAGVACDMDVICALAERHGIAVVEDAAHAILSTYKGRPLGSIGDLATFSFHETKNFSAGEGGALIINNTKFSERAEILREKGTNRSQFFRGEVDKYSWVDIGGSFLPSEVIAAFLFGQLEHAEAINSMRIKLWQQYYRRLSPLMESGFMRLPVVPDASGNNAHMFYILLPSERARNSLMDYLRTASIHAVFHYLPLHSSAQGQRLGYRYGDLPVTERVSETVLRLPLFCGLRVDDIDYICDTIHAFFLPAVSEHHSFPQNGDFFEDSIGERIFRSGSAHQLKDGHPEQNSLQESI